MIKEIFTTKIDASGRIGVPVYFRKKYGIKPKDKLQYYTFEKNGKWYIAFTKEDTEEE